jgi:hypothetical protein
MDRIEAKRAWAHGAFTAWIIGAIVLAVVVWKLWDQSNKIQKRTDENRALIVQIRHQGVSIKELQHEAVASCSNYLHLRHAVNKFHSSLSGLLLTAEKARLASYRRTHQRCRPQGRTFLRETPEEPVDGQADVRAKEELMPGKKYALDQEARDVRGSSPGRHVEAAGRTDLERAGEEDEEKGEEKGPLRQRPFPARQRRRRLLVYLRAERPKPPFPHRVELQARSGSSRASRTRSRRSRSSPSPARSPHRRKGRGSSATGHHPTRARSSPRRDLLRLPVHRTAMVRSTASTRRSQRSARQCSRFGEPHPRAHTYRAWR